MLDRLQRSHETQQRFVSDASHELRSPIAAIRQHAEVAQAHPDRTTVDELATTVLAEDLRMQCLVDDLLLLARSDEAGRRPAGYAGRPRRPGLRRSPTVALGDQPDDRHHRRCPPARSAATRPRWPG